LSSGKVLLGILTGAAAGALLGVLFAPEKGSVTRKKISKKGEDYAEARRLLRSWFRLRSQTLTDGSLFLLFPGHWNKLWYKINHPVA